MGKINAPLFSLNAGEVSKDALARVDLEKMAMAAETMVNLMPTTLGPMQFRGGTKYIGSTSADKVGFLIPFVFSAAEVAFFEITTDGLRIRRSDTLISRPSVTTSITNGNFSSSLATGWTDESGTGADADTVSDELILTGGSFESAKVRQEVTCAGGNIGVLHGLSIKVTAGPVSFRCGSAAGDDDYIAKTNLGTGTHSLGFTPTGNFWVEFEGPEKLVRKVNRISIESSGVIVLPTPWDSSSDFPLLRWDQSADVVFIACDGYQPYKIERRSWDSWSIVRYEVTQGPWRLPNLTRVTMTPGARRGITTLTSSSAYFKADHVGAIFRLVQRRQYIEEVLTGPAQFSSAIRVTGVGNDRDFLINISGTWTGTIVLERSYGNEDNYNIYKQWTINQTNNPIKDAQGSTAHDDFDQDNPKEDNDNQIIYYRMGSKSNVVMTGSATVSMDFNGGAQIGVAKVLSLTSSTIVEVEVLKTFSAANPTDDWREGEWSDLRGWPSAVALHDGRLFWAGGDKLWGSVSDDFENFDPDVEGDSGPINRTVASGPADGISWILSLPRLIIGTASAEIVVRSSAFDEPLTPSNFTARTVSTRGVENVGAVAVDAGGIFVQRSGRRAYELVMQAENGEYGAAELTRTNQTVLGAGVVRMAVQRHPDTRVWFVRDDGSVACLIYERGERVVGWCRHDFGGTVKDVMVLPGDTADSVYFVVQRTINGSTKVYIEKLATEDEAEGEADNYMLDCAIKITQSSSTTISGLSHLEGQQVIVWSNGVALRDQSNKATVASGAITVSSAVTSAIVGLPYEGQYKSTKLAYAAGLGTALVQRKRIDHLGIIARNICLDGVTLGPSFTSQFGMPKINPETGASVAAGTVIADYDFDASGFAGGWSTDSRICMEFQAPYPAKILGLVVSQTTNDLQLPRPPDRPKADRGNSSASQDEAA